MVKFVVSLVGGISLGGIYAMVALGIVLAFRATGTFNFAHGQFMLLPAYCIGAWQASGGAPIGVSMVTAILLIAVISGLFYLVVLQRTTGLSHFMGVIATLGLAAVLDGAMLIIFGSQSYSFTMPGLPQGVVEIFGARVSTASIVLSIFTISMSLLVAGFVRFTHIGRSLRVSGQDAVLASQSGINVRMLHLVSWCLAGALAGIAGLAFASTNLVDPTMSHIALAAFPAIVIGGMDSVGGSIVGGLLVGVFQGFVATYHDPQYLEVSTYALLLIAMLLMPQGMFGTRQVTRV